MKIDLGLSFNRKIRTLRWIFLSEVSESLTHREIFSESCYSKPNLYCNYNFPIDLTPIGISIGTKYIGKEYLQSKFSLNYRNFENIPPRVPHIILGEHREICSLSIQNTCLANCRHPPVKYGRRRMGGRCVTFAITFFLFVREADTQRNIFEILLNESEIKLYLPFSD